LPAITFKCQYVSSDDYIFEGTTELALFSNPSTLPVKSPAMANPSMPTHGHTTALKFSPDQPHELRRYFEELEVLFGSCNIIAEPEMKKYACRYLDIDTSDFWQSITECGGATTYANWKVAIYK
jgi:hypothetical protein